MLPQRRKADPEARPAARLTSCIASPRIRALREWGHSSAGRAPAWHAGGRRFDPVWLHHFRDVLAASPSSRGLGHNPFTVATGVRIPVGTPLESRGCVRDDRTRPGIGPPVSQPTAFSLQPARGAHLLRVAGNAEFEQIRRFARRTTRGGRGGLDPGTHREHDS